MTQEAFPEIQAATEALEKRITLTEKEVEQMKEGITTRKKLLRSWRKALAAFTPSRPARKSKTVRADSAGATK